MIREDVEAVEAKDVVAAVEDAPDEGTTFQLVCRISGLGWLECTTVALYDTEPFYGLVVAIDEWKDHLLTRLGLSTRTAAEEIEREDAKKAKLDDEGPPDIPKELEATRTSLPPCHSPRRGSPHRGCMWGGECVGDGL